MTDVFAEGEGQRRREAGMALASGAQERKHRHWSDQAYAAIRAIATRQDEVFVDDVLGAFALVPDHPNAWGHVWQRALRDGLIAHSGRIRPSADPKKHKHQYPVYRSLICGGAPATQETQRSAL